MKSKPSPYMQVLWDKPKMTSHCLLTSKVSFGLGSTIKDITAQGKEGVNSLVTTYLSLNMNRLTRGWGQICFRIVIYRLKFRFRKKLKLSQTNFFISDNHRELHYCCYRLQPLRHRRRIRKTLAKSLSTSMAHLLWTWSTGKNGFDLNN